MPIRAFPSCTTCIYRLVGPEPDGAAEAGPSGIRVRWLPDAWGGKLRCWSVPHLSIFCRSISDLYKTVEQAGHSVQVGGRNARGRELLEEAGSGTV